jgi:hypothetical protein
MQVGRSVDRLAGLKCDEHARTARLVVIGLKPEGACILARQTLGIACGQIEMLEPEIDLGHMALLGDADRS